ncbi:MAG: HNH endonuclease [Candidatus Binatia bacterium]
MLRPPGVQLQSLSFSRETSNKNSVQRRNAQKNRLIDLCQSELDVFVERGGKSIYDHRRVSVGYISGTLKYEGSSKPDHILPYKHGGREELSNLQALCYSCNAMKRDRDDTDFRAIRESYEYRKAGCLFCETAAERISAQNELAYAIADAYPVSPLHTLIFPSGMSLRSLNFGQAEVNACTVLINQQKKQIESGDRSVNGSILATTEQAQARPIEHCHVHLIPRPSSEVVNPRGGVRHTIQGKVTIKRNRDFVS